MNTMISKSIFKIGTTFSILLIIYLFYLWYTYIDDTVTIGNGYGFVIGDTKSITFSKLGYSLPKISKDKNIYIQIMVTESVAPLLSTNVGHTLMVQTFLHDIGFKELETKDQWEFFVGGSYFNKLSLKFCDQKLCEIYRHKKYFELP